MANCGTLQGGVLSPLLWNLKLSTMFNDTQKTCCKAVAYAHDVALIMTGKDLKLLPEILGLALRLLVKWYQNCGLRVNPQRQNCSFLLEDTKFPTPKIENVPLQLSSETKYLGIVLDSKLNWNQNITSRISKATTEPYCYKRTIGLNCGQTPNNTHWLCRCVIILILF